MMATVKIVQSSWNAVWRNAAVMDYVNEAFWDRVLRILVGLAMIYLGWVEAFPGLWSAAARIFGFFPLLTGIVGWSPLYAILGLRTKRPYRRRTEGRSRGASPPRPPAVG